MARKRKQGGKTSSAAMPVMRPDAAGIDIGATEIFVAVPVIVQRRTCAHFPLSPRTCMYWPIGSMRAGSRRWRWSPPASTLR